jgi:murein DD-endopeptidase MepM/ murein hydrolase activator NlpD
MKFNKLSIIIVLFLVVGGFLAWQQKAKTQFAKEQTAIGLENEIIEDSPFETKKVEITQGSTYGALMESVGIDATTANEILTASQSAYDLSKIRAGRTLDLLFEKSTNEFQQLIYQIDNTTELVVEKKDGVWSAEVINIAYDVVIEKAEGIIKSSMYEAGLAAGIDERAVIEFANAMQWSVDFAMDVRVNDTFAFVYEKRFRNGEYIMPGKVLAGKYINDGRENYVFYFEESEDNKGYFDKEGNSVQTLFLKAPVEYRYISSGFTTGLRYVQAFNVSTGHRAIDYATAAGTPIRSVGDGTVTFSGWNGPYGNFVTIRHNGTYSTNYAHMSKIAVKKGERISQGQVIGYVGSTGFSTGPHLHYEMVKNGVRVNPLTEVLPPGEKIKEENLEKYFAHIKEFSDQLGLN